jgi:hypothetical protein
MLARLEKRFGRYAIPNLTVILAGGQVLFYFAAAVNESLMDAMVLDSARVREGEWWRLLAFMFMPKAWHPLFFVIGVLVFWFMGRALEEQWGAFRYNIFLLIGYLATIAAVMISPTGQATNYYLLWSVLLAFALLYPDFTILLFFILPVKVKWIGLFVWMIYAISFVGGDMVTRLTILAAVLNILLFFWPDLVAVVRRQARTVKRQAQASAERDEPFHRCTICGKTERSHPKLDFRYCPQCTGSPCYCEDHIQNHQHR